jgi:1-acyl-sn-glycerol-3-phosphate acyltransferase
MDTCGYTWKYEPVKEMSMGFTEHLRKFPRETGFMGSVIHGFFCLFLKIWFKVWNRLDITGIENLPERWSYVIVANHSSHLDAPALISMFPPGKAGRVYPAAAADYFFKGPVSSVFSAFCMNALPFERKEKTASTITACRSLLSEKDNVLIVFPEGTRTATGEINEFKAGIGLVLTGTKIPVVACRISGTFERHPKGSRFPKYGSIRIDIGRPKIYVGLAPGKESAEIIARELRYEVTKLETGPAAQPGLIPGLRISHM